MEALCRPRQNVTRGHLLRTISAKDAIAMCLSSVSVSTLSLYQTTCIVWLWTQWRIHGGQGVWPPLSAKSNVFFCFTICSLGGHRLPIHRTEQFLMEALCRPRQNVTRGHLHWTISETCYSRVSVVSACVSTLWNYMYSLPLNTVAYPQGGQGVWPPLSAKSSVFLLYNM